MYAESGSKGRLFGEEEVKASIFSISRYCLTAHGLIVQPGGVEAVLAFIRAMSERTEVQYDDVRRAFVVESGVTKRLGMSQWLVTAVFELMEWPLEGGRFIECVEFLLDESLVQVEVQDRAIIPFEYLIDMLVECVR